MLVYPKIAGEDMAAHAGVGDFHGSKSTPSQKADRGYQFISLAGIHNPLLCHPDRRVCQNGKGFHPCLLLLVDITDIFKLAR